MSGLAEQIWRAFVFGELPFHSVNLPLLEEVFSPLPPSTQVPSSTQVVSSLPAPTQVVTPLPLSTHHCPTCNNVEIIIDGDGRLDTLAWCICYDEEEEDEFTLCCCPTCLPDF